MSESDATVNGEGALLEGLRRERLDNGVGLWFLPMAGQPMVSVRLLVPAGAQHEKEGESGIAHLVEHLAFDFTRSRELSDIFNAVEDAGGEIGAVTGPEDVVFTAEAPPELIERALELLCDCWTGASFERERVEAERRVLLRELSDFGASRDRVDLSRLTWERLLASHPSTRDPAGDPVVVERLTPERLEAFFRACYGSEGLSLVIVGDLSFGDARAMAERTVGALPRAAAPEPPPPAEARNKELSIRDPKVWDEMLVGYRTDGVRSDDYFAHWYTRDYLTEELYDDVRREHHVYYLACELVARDRAGMLFVLVRAAEADHDPITRRVDEAFAALAGAPLDDERFARLRARLVNRARRIAETSDEMAEHLLSLAAHYRLDEPVPDDVERLAAVTAEELHQASTRCFVKDRRVEARSKGRALGSRWRAGLLLVALVVAVLGLQERCHQRREAALRQELVECRESLETEANRPRHVLCPEALPAAPEPDEQAAPP